MLEIEAAVGLTDTKPNQYNNKDVTRVPTLTDSHQQGDRF